RRSFTEKILRSRGMSFARIGSYPAAAGLVLREKLLRKGHLPCPKNAVIEHCTGFDDRFDSFWEQLRAKRKDILLGNRSRATLEWHFHKPLIMTYSKPSQLTAYAIFQRKDYRQLRLTRARLIDVQTLGEACVLTNILS